MREMDFKVEQMGVVEVGQTIKVSEGTLPGSYYYILEHSYGMSANYVTRDRLKSTEGKIIKLETTSRGQYATVVFDE